VTGSFNLNDSATNFNIVGNGFGQTYLQSLNGAIVLNPGYGGVEITGVNNRFNVTDGYITNLYASNGVVSGSSQIVEYNVFATTGSNQFDGNQAITGSLTVTGQVVAQTLNVQQVTSSIVYSSGSNIFGNSLGNTQQFTGSVSVTGSLTVVTAGIELQVTSTGVNIGNALTDVHTITGSLGINGQGTFYQPLTNSTSYLTVQNNRARNAAVQTTTTNGSFIAGTSIGTDTFNYQIYDGVAGSARLTISSTGAATFSNIVNVGYDSNNRSTIRLTSNAANRQAAIYFYGNNAESSVLGYEGGSEIVSGGVQGDFVIRNVLANKHIILATNNGNVGIGTLIPTGKLSVEATGNHITLRAPGATAGKYWALDITTENRFYLMNNAGTQYLTITDAGAATFTSSVTARDLFNLRGDTAANNSQSVITFTNLRSGTWNNAQIEAETGGQVWAGNLVFRTASTGFANVLTERMRITSEGNLLVQKQAVNNTDTGIGWFVNDYFCVTNNSADAGDRVVLINRQNSDGELIEFRQGNVAEGDITISGTTVSYNGGHLSRYSQTELNEKIEGLLKGTVMSNLDQMAVWINPETGEPYENEQLNCMKISDVDGDKNVAGVFVNWQYDSELLTNDMNIAMTGDMIIRIAEGVVVEKGDLLISAGDGTAKPQSDDLIRSNTIAKVISNHVTCTYEDGSYCVPCVLMAC
jgi:hypothetical protein